MLGTSAVPASSKPTKLRSTISTVFRKTLAKTDERYLKIQNTISKWIGDYSGPYRKEHEWTLEEDGLPTLAPIYMVKDDLYGFLGQGIDSRTQSGGHRFYCFVKNHGWRECLLYLYMHRRENFATLIHIDGIMEDVLVRVPEFCYETGGTLVNAFDHGDGIYAFDMIVSRGAHVANRNIGMGERLAMLASPIGPCPERLKFIQKEELLLSSRRTARQERLEAIVRKVREKKMNMCDSNNDTVASSSSATNVIKKKTSQIIIPTFVQTIDSQELEMQQLVIKIIPYTVFPELPTEKMNDSQCESLYLRGHADFAFSYPLQYGSPPLEKDYTAPEIPDTKGIQMNRDLVIGITSNTDNEQLTNDDRHDGHKTMLGHILERAPKTLFFKLPKHRSDFAFHFNVKPSERKGFMQLWSANNITSPIAIVNDNKRKETITIPGVVHCAWDEVLSEYKLLYNTIDQKNADHDLILKRTRQAHDQGLTINYLQELLQIVAQKRKGIKLSADDIERVVQLAPGIDTFTLPLLV